MRSIARFFIILLAIIGGLTLLIGAAGGLALWKTAKSVMKGEIALPERMVLTVDLSRPLFEAPSPGFSPWNAAPLSLREAVLALKTAAGDPRVIALSGDLGAAPLMPATAQEARAALEVFRASGKPMMLFSEGLGESAPGMTDYYLASAFAQVWLQPSGVINISPYALDIPFAREALDKVGVAFDFSARWEYKTAMDSFLRDDMSGAHRASLRRLVESWQTQMAASVAKARGMSPEALDALIDAPPLLAGEALAAGLVDRLGYRDQYDAALSAATGEAETVALDAYAHSLSDDLPSDVPTIALVNAIGEVRRGSSESYPGGDSLVLGSETVAKAIADAADDPKVKAIVLRIDSPGGDYVGADAIWRETRRAHDKHIPVIASFGDVAASGGYFIAMPADVIVAQPGAITGSIGVLTGKPVIAALWDKLGVTWETVSARNGEGWMWTPNRPFTASEKAWVEKTLDAIYEDFTEKLMLGRGLSPLQVDRAARGRVWSGADAKAVGLVDDLGGLDAAIAIAKRRAGLDGEDGPVAVVSYPPRPTGLDALLSALRKLDGAGLISLLSMGSKVAGEARRLEAAGVLASRPAVRAPVFSTR